jgi:hypothetical protein
MHYAFLSLTAASLGWVSWFCGRQVLFPSVTGPVAEYPEYPYVRSPSLEDVPANYGYFHFQQPLLATEIHVDHKWIAIPSVSDNQPNVFSSTTYNFENGANAYMGSQVVKEGFWMFAKMKGKFIFSVWDTRGGKPTWIGSNCGPFGGEGTGAHCILTLDIKPFVKYSVRVRFIGHYGDGDHWVGTVTDPLTGSIHTIGTLVHPGPQGFGKIAVRGMLTAFQEWFTANGCTGQAYAAVAQYGPWLNGAVTPTQVLARYKPNHCFTSDVTGCVPNDGCGFPRLYMRGGGYTKRSTITGQALWGGSADEISQIEVASNTTFSERVIV